VIWALLLLTMATAAEFVLPEKYSEDLKDEHGNPMSKRWGVVQACAPHTLQRTGWQLGAAAGRPACTLQPA
jgi:hypothetical protein